MKRFLALLVLMVPAAAGQGVIMPDYPTVEGLMVTPGNQRLDIAWDAVDDSRITSYAVYVYKEGRLVRQENRTETTWTYSPAENDRAYVVEVAAQDAAGNQGPRTVAFTQPRFEQDQTYLAAGLVVVWVGMWGYAILLARSSRDLAERLNRIQKEKNRLREQG